MTSLSVATSIMSFPSAPVVMGTTLQTARNASGASGVSLLHVSKGEKLTTWEYGLMQVSIEIILLVWVLSE